MKKTILFLLLPLLPMLASAETVEINGIFYNLIIKGKAAEVTSNPVKYSGDVAIPNIFYYDNVEFTVTSIGENAFSDCNRLNSVTIPNSVTTICDYAFQNSSLTSVNIPNSVTYIGKNAFEKTKLTSVNIPNSLKSISNKAFSLCFNLKTIIIPNSVKVIGASAFYKCSGLNMVQISDIGAWCQIKFVDSDSNPLGYAKRLYLDGEEIKNLIIPNSVTTIGESAFEYCNLTSVIIPNSVTYIGNYAFMKSSLTSVEIPNSLTELGTSVFNGCKYLTSVTIPNSIKSIGMAAFADCSSLISIEIPESVTTIGDNAFRFCRSLSSITIPNSVTSIGSHAFDECEGLISVSIPNSIKRIDRYTFSGCKNLSTITIPNSVKGIDEYAFYNCSSLILIRIGSGIHFIYEGAFKNCSELKDIYCLAEDIYSSNNRNGLYTYISAFDGSYIEYATLHVPAASIEGYRQTEPWSGFGEIVALTDDETLNPGDANGDEVVNAADIVEAVNAMNGHPSTNYKAKNADIDGNGVVNQADINAIVEIIMNLNK